MSLTDSIAAFATGTYTVTRTAAGAPVLGRYTPGATSTFDIVASVQPMSGRELQSLPEARSTMETRVIYTTTELQATPDADTIAIDGEDWEVFRVERWQFGTASTHYRAYASRLEVP